MNIIVNNISEVLKGNKDLIISAFLGAFGIFVLRLIIRGVHAYNVRMKPIAEFPCYYDQKGCIENKNGKLSHSLGDACEDKSSKHGTVWCHSEDKIDNGCSTIYGPYMNVFGVPGNYIVRFRMKATGYNKNEQICWLQVVQNLVVYDSQIKRPVHYDQSPLCDRNVIGRDFRKFKYKNIDLKLYYNGTGASYEFRVFVQNFNTDKKVLFDYISVYKYIPFLEWFS